MKHHERTRRKAILLPRSGRKTTYCTQADAIQIALPDDLGTAPYPRNLGPNVRLCIVHESSIMASRILGFITQHFIGNDLLKYLFPEITPGPQQRNNTSELELKRTSKWMEPTFDTMGVGTKAQGRHYNRLKLDDIYGPDTRDSKTLHDKTIQWFDELEPFFVSAVTDGFDLVGTRYAFSDVYSHAFEKYGEDLPRYVRAAEEYRNGQWQSYCPELLPLKDMLYFKKNRKLWISNYLNSPDDREDAELQPDWLRYWQWLDARRIVGFTGTERIVRDVDELDKLILIDPAINGDAGWVVTGTDYISNKPNVFVLEAERGVWPPEVLANKVFQAVLKYGPRAVVIESVLFSALYKPYFESEMRHRGIYFNIIEAKTRQREKDARVRGLSPYFAAGQMFLHQDQKDLLMEYERFGLGDSYHVLDALAYGPEHWRAAVNRELVARRKESERKFLASRDPITGYSRVG